MKEANLLVFRDYSVKLGDFGISLKLDENEDPSEEVYDIKGVTPGYSLPQIEESLRTGSGDTFSQHKLFKNDYYSLTKTFSNIKATCEKTFTVEGIGLPASDFMYQLYNVKFDPDSYFCQMLTELETLNPATSSLHQLLLKYQAIVSKDEKFLINFLD
mmetsp:Transcript_24308/g.18489  ORF Transcript_24308/g.18489 Transcript_24308/m.18489 type:complete len:158 (-) Transcript_24308:2362-2835(-)